MEISYVDYDLNWDIKRKIYRTLESLRQLRAMGIIEDGDVNVRQKVGGLIQKEVSGANVFVKPDYSDVVLESLLENGAVASKVSRG